jgi:Zn-dependent protease with chaperone function
VITAHDVAAQVLLHSLAATVVVETVLRRLPVIDPARRIAYRLIVLVLPLATTAMLLVAPERTTDAFAAGAVFFSPGWQRLVVGGLGIRDWILVAAAVTGSALLLRDLASMGPAWWRERRRQRAAGATAAVLPPEFHEELATQCAAMGMRVPPTRVLDSPAPVFHCAGLLRPSLVVSPALVSLLPREQLRSAIAHELSHLQRGDLAFGWLLLLLRLVQWFNPLAQVVARRITQELEWIADDEAVAGAGGPHPLVRALVTCARARHADYLGLLGPSRIAAVEERCRRLLAPPEPAPPPAWHVLATGTALAVMAYFIV